MDDVKKALQALHEALGNYPASPPFSLEAQQDHTMVISTLRGRLQYVLTHEFSEAELVTFHDELGRIFEA